MRFTCPFTVCLVVLLLPHGVQAGGPKVPIKPWKEIFILKALPAPAGDDKLRHLLVARYNEIAGEMKSVITLKYLAEPHPWYDEAMVDVSRRLFRAALDFDDARERVSLYADILGQLKQIEQKFEVLEKTVKDPRTRLQLSRFRSLRMEVEINLLRTEKSLKP